VFPDIDVLRRSWVWHSQSSPNAAINLASEAVNKRHASIRYRDGAFVFWDLASENYSFLVGPDGKRSRILQPHKLSDGDTLDLADSRLTFIEINE
jgi:pSer/pThr/pTyr-binding forkhead associated (FHA) protein